ncbi:MAG: hemerythrin domain-containing protein [Nitrococcus mobilis]|nr:hemerythrin domain-containing protein [Nitrococcus mobilis]
MVTAIQRLRQEHRDLSRLLDVLERQLDAIRGERTPDYHLMRNILHYLMEYPNHYHHPYEDLVYDRLAERVPSMANVVEYFLAEHDRLATLGWQSLTLVERVLNGELVARAEVHASGSAFAREYRAHMQRENEEILTAAEASLTATDWLQIDAMFERRPDPLFGPEVAAEYQALRECITIETAQREFDRAGKAYCSACATD